MAHIPSSYDTHSNAHANFPSLPERDPCTPEQIKYDFQLLQERTILGGELRFAIRASLHGHRDHFPTINASNRPRFCLKRPCIHPQNGFERPQNRSQNGQIGYSCRPQPHSTSYSTTTKYEVHTYPVARTASETRISTPSLRG